MQPRALVIAAVVLCAAVVSAFDPFIADEHATAEVAPIRAAAPEQPLPAPAKSVQEPAATPQPTPPRPPAALATPADVQSPVPPTKGEPAVPAPVPIGPAKPVVRSPSVNVTAVPTATPSIKQRALEAKKSGGSNALFDVKVKGTRVAITPSGDVMVRNPDIDINTMRVVQMVAGLVKAAKRVAEAAQTHDKRAEKQQSVSHAKSSDSDENEKENESDDDDDGDDDDENDKGKPKGKGAQAPPVIVKQKVTIAGGDADGVSARMQPLPQDVIGDGPVRSSGGSLVDDAKPYARKLHYRVRRDYTRGAGSVGDLRFDAPITMQLQQISTIPRSEFAPDSYRFAVDVPGQPLFFVDLPQRQ